MFESRQVSIPPAMIIAARRKHDGRHHFKLLDRWLFRLFGALRLASLRGYTADALVVLRIAADFAWPFTNLNRRFGNMAFSKFTRRKIFAFVSGSSILAALITTRIKHRISTPTGILFSDQQLKLLSTTGQAPAGAYYLFYLTGTLTVANAYADGLLTTRLSHVPGATQPICTADSAGRFNPIYLDPTVTYRAQLYNAAG